jgi:hypothetical protein
MYRLFPYNEDVPGIFLPKAFAYYSNVLNLMLGKESKVERTPEEVILWWYDALPDASTVVSLGFSSQTGITIFWHDDNEPRWIEEE